MLVKLDHFPNFRGETKKYKKKNAPRALRCLVNQNLFLPHFAAHGHRAFLVGLQSTWSSRESPWRWTRTSSPHPAVFMSEIQWMILVLVKGGRDYIYIHIYIYIYMGPPNEGKDYTWKKLPIE